jgi:hypothetical protein
MRSARSQSVFPLMPCQSTTSDHRFGDDAGIDGSRSRRGAGLVSVQALRRGPKRLHRPAIPHRHRRPIPPGLRSRLVSVAGAIGVPVVEPSGARIGSLADVVVRWDPGETHPPLHGVVVRIGRTLAFIGTDAIAALSPGRVETAGAFVPLPARDAGLVALAHDVLDRQIVDVDGVDIVRVSDLVLGAGPRGAQLVGVDVSARTLLRRLGPAWLRRRVAIDRLRDWASVGAFSVRAAGEAGSVLKLTQAADRLSSLDPAELELLLSDLPPDEGQALGAAVEGR